MKKYHIYLILCGTMVIWGFNVIATKILVTHFMPVTMTAFRIFTAACSVFLVLFAMKKVRSLNRQEFSYIFFGALLNVVGHHYFLSVGLSKTSASNGGLILGLGPLLTAVMAAIFLGSAMSVLRVLGIVLGMAGVSFIVLEGSGGLGAISIGDVDVFVSIFLQAASFILIKKASETLDPRLMTGYMMLIGSGFLFMIGLLLEPNGLEQMKQGSVGIWTVFFGSAILATAFGHMIYNFAIKEVGAAEASIFLNLNPFFALVGAALFLGEEVVITQILGFVCILCGVLLGSGSVEEFYLQRRRKMG